MIKGKPQLIYGGGHAAAPVSARQKAAAGLGSQGGSVNFSSYLPQAGNAAGNTPIVSTRLPNGQYAFQSAQPLPQAPGWNGGNSLSLSTSQMRRQAVQHARTGNTPGGMRSLPEARSQGNAVARSMMGMSNVGGMLHQPVVGGKSAPRVSGRPITGRGGIGMEDTRLKRSGNNISNRRRAATQQEVLAANGPPESLGIMQPARSRLAALGPNAYAGFAARFQTPGLNQSFLTQGFGSRNAQAVLQSKGYDLGPVKNPRTSAQLLQPPASVQLPAKSAAVSSQVKKRVELPKEKYPQSSLVPTFYSMAKSDLGSLAAKFESGEEGIAAIGYDRKGGTSYGKYQISSRAGTMSGFITYLGDQAPDLARRLAQAGPANTGSRRGRMPEVWRQIAAEDPQRFERLQGEFVRTSHFEPAIQSIAEATGISFDTMPKALQEVLFSTAVQHGPVGAARIVSRAVDRVDKSRLQKLGKGGGHAERNAERQLIQNIYNLRASQFVSSTSRVRGAVQQRLRVEMQEALEMLG